MWAELVRNTLLLTSSLGLNEHPDRRPTKRSKDWPRVRREFMREEGNGECKLCGAKKNLQVHHIVPFHIDPSLELDKDNLVTLCNGPGITCHITFGHLGNYRYYNPEVIEDIYSFRAKILLNKIP